MSRCCKESQFAAFTKSLRSGARRNLFLFIDLGFELSFCNSLITSVKKALSFQGIGFMLIVSLGNGVNSLTSRCCRLYNVKKWWSNDGVEGVNTLNKRSAEACRKRLDRYPNIAGGGESGFSHDAILYQRSFELYG